MYKKIVNPETGRKVSINNKIGKKILSNYINVLRGGKRIDGSFRGIVNEFCGDDAIVIASKRNCSERQLISLEFIDSDFFNNLMIAYSDVFEGEKNMDDTKLIEKITAMADKVKFPFHPKNITKDNTIILEGFYSKYINLDTDKENSTFVHINSPSLLPRYKTDNLEIANKNIHGKVDNRMACNKTPCYKFNRGLGKKVLVNRLKEQYKNGKEYVILEAAGDDGLQKYYEGLKFVVLENYGSKLMIAKITDII